MLENFHFLRPAWLIMLLPLAGVLLYLARRKWAGNSWGAICDESLLPYILMTGRSANRGHLTILLTGIGGVLTVLALAGPAWQQLPQPLFDDQASLVILLDLSRSMDTGDIQPSRLARARFKINDIINTRGSGQTALVVYANDAYLVAPLTSDVNTIRSQIPALTTDIMPVHGNNITAAIEQGGKLLKQARIKWGHMLLLTDGIDEQDIQRAVQGLSGENYRLSVLGIGTRAGGPIPLSGGGFLKDKHGAIVISTYDEGSLRRLATAGGGIYQRMSLDATDVENIIKAIEAAPVIEQNALPSELKADLWQEQGPWLLLLLIPLAAWSFRRGYVFIICLFLLPVWEPVYAFSWQDLWLTKDQQAAGELRRGDNAAAAEKFSDPAWRATAHYRADNFAAAVEALDKAEDADGLYNKANALAKSGQYDQAIEAYQQSLRLQPDNEDAQYNLDLVKKALSEQQSTESQSGKEEQQGEQSEPGEEGQQGEQQQAAQSAPGEEEQQGEQSEPGEEGQQGEQQQAAQSEPGEEEQQGEQQQASQSEPGEEEGQDEQQPAGAQQQTAATMGEVMQATEQWLRRIPDDPGGLLKRKFKHQYKQRDGGDARGEQW